MERCTEPRGGRDTQQERERCLELTRTARRSVERGGERGRNERHLSGETDTCEGRGGEGGCDDELIWSTGERATALRGAAAAAAAATAGGRWHLLSLLELRDRVQTERKKSPGSLSPPPAFPSRFSGESHACRYLGWQSQRAGTEGNRGSFICTVRRRGKKKNPAREAVKVLSIQFSVYLGASHQAAPSPCVWRGCALGPSVWRDREKKMLQASLCK